MFENEKNSNDVQKWYRLDEEKYKLQIKRYNELFSKIEEVEDENKLTLMWILAAQNNIKETEKI